MYSVPGNPPTPSHWIKQVRQYCTNKYLCTPWSYLHCQFSRHHFTPRDCNIAMSWTSNWLLHFVLFEPCRALPHENLISHSHDQYKKMSFSIFPYPATTSPAYSVALLSSPSLPLSQQLTSTLYSLCCRSRCSYQYL